MSMKKNILHQFKAESGVTLVELLAAIAILSIVVTAFLGFFIQAGRTNSRTDDVNEATFIAQEEMEYITSFSTGGYSSEEALNGLFPNGCNSHTEDEGNYQVTRFYELPEEGSNLYRIKVVVQKGGKIHAQMETYIPFEKKTTE